jgi:eukaryotic-like serine/threonine-protein kinase
MARTPMARHPSSPETERRALALFEHLADQPGNIKLRARLTRGEPEEVLTRLRALEASVTRAAGAIPTLIPGSADFDSISRPPERIGAFRLVERIGRGGMGDVWLGQRDDGLYDQKIAIKLIQRHALKRVGGAFDDERRFLARLEHPNIARLIDGGVTEDGLPWLAMEYFDGQPIDVASADRPLNERVRLLIKAADAVQYAHSRLVAHADLKPSNILVDADGRVKLLDFGIASLIGDGARSPTGSGPLTRDFASPQRIAGGGPSVADDVFALGKTMAFMLDGTSNVELTAIAAKAQNTDEATRYGSAAELIADLDRWRAQLPVHAMHDGLSYRMGKFIERHRIGVAATSAAILLLGATSLIASINYFRAERERDKAADRFQDAHRAANYLMFDVMTRLEKRPGSLKMRADIARVAQTYLDRLASTPGAPPQVQIDTAAGLLRIAEITGVSTAPSLADSQRAKGNLTRATAILRRQYAADPKNPKLLATLANAYTQQCRMQIYGDHAPDKALALAKEGEALLTAQGQFAGQEDALWPLRICRGDALVWRNETTPAIALLSSELARAQARENAQPGTISARAIARNLRFLGEAYFYANRLSEAATTHQEAFDLLTKERERFPTDQTSVNDYVSVADDLASTYSLMKRQRDGLVIARKAHAATVEAVRQDASDLNSLRRGLAIARVVAALQAELGETREAIALMAQTHKGWHTLITKFPDDAAIYRAYVLSIRVRGDVHRLAGQRETACHWYKTAQTGWATLDKRWGVSPSDKTEDVAYIEQDLKACAGQGKFVGT